MDKNVWLYFNSSNDDSTIALGNDRVNGMWPAKNLISVQPYGNEYISFVFKSMMNDSAALHDQLLLTTKGENQAFDIIKNLTRNINNTSPTFDGFINVADISYTKVDGTVVPGKFITDNRQEPGQIIGFIKFRLQWLSSGNKMDTKYTIPDFTQTSEGYLLAAATSGSANTISSGGFYNVMATDSDHFIRLPNSSLGTVVWLNCTKAPAFELRTTSYEAPNSGNTDLINNSGGTADNESVIAADTALVRCICVQPFQGNLTHKGRWICTKWDNDGVEAVVPDAD